MSVSISLSDVYPQRLMIKWALIWRLPDTKTLNIGNKLQQLQCKVTVIVLALKRSISVTPSSEESSVSAESLTSIWQQRQTEHTKTSNNSTQSTILAMQAGTFPSLKLNQNLFSAACEQRLLWGFRTGADFHTDVLGYWPGRFWPFSYNPAEGCRFTALMMLSGSRHTGADIKASLWLQLWVDINTKGRTPALCDHTPQLSSDCNVQPDWRHLNRNVPVVTL